MLIGNVGKDPELKHTASGIPFISFRMATTETWKNHEGELKEHTDWHSVIAWRGLAEIIYKLVRKGSRVFIEGKLQTRYIDDAESGIKKQIVEILAENMLILDTRHSAGFEESLDLPAKKDANSEEKTDIKDDADDTKDSSSDFGF
jgi:single-strand DNA-binding protein